jgi:hypothetical protein
LKILVIGDDAIPWKLITNGLGRDGYETGEAETAGILNREEPVVLVIPDLMLPAMNSLDLLAGIRAYLDMLEHWVGTLRQTPPEMEGNFSSPAPLSPCSRMSARGGAGQNSVTRGPTLAFVARSESPIRPDYPRARRGARG